MKRSKFLSLNTRDFFKGLIVAVITAVLTLMYDSVQRGVSLDLSLLKACGMTALASVLAYLLKNLFTNQNGEILTQEKDGQV